MSKKADLVNIYNKYSEIIEELNISEPAQSSGVFGTQPTVPSGNTAIKINTSEDEECETHPGETNLEMAKAEIFKIAKSVNELMNLINTCSKMEPWMLSKLVKACDYVCAVKNVIEYDEFEKCQNDVTSGMNELNSGMIVVSKIKDMLSSEDINVNEEVLKQIIFNIECLKENN